jgi:hypothetical protein
MAYADLNSIRTGIAATPKDSEFTSLYARIETLRRPPSSNAATSSSNTVMAPPLMGVRDRHGTSTLLGLGAARCHIHQPQ